MSPLLPADPSAEPVLRPCMPRIEQRVRFVPVTPYAIQFHTYLRGEPGVYTGRPADGGGPKLAADADGAAQDGFAMSNYLMWVEERTVYTAEPDPWEVTDA